MTATMWLLLSVLVVLAAIGVHDLCTRARRHRAEMHAVVHSLNTQWSAAS